MAGMLGKRHTKESNQKNREAHLGKRHIEKTKKKMSEAHKNHKPDCQCASCKAKRGEFYHTEETRRKIGLASKGREYSEESRKKMSEKAKLRTDEKHSRWKGGSRHYWQKKSRKVWEKYHGKKIPPGHDIHHKDGNWKNIDPKNLKSISHLKHPIWHAQLRRLKERSKKFLEGN